MVKERSIRRAFVEVADTLVDDYDLIEFLQMLTGHCAALFGVTEVGVALADDAGKLHALGSSSERVRTLELLEIQTNDGPCLDAWSGGRRVSSDDLAADIERWPGFVPAAIEHGFNSAYAIPMRLREHRLGALTLFGADLGALSESDQELGQALADVATIGILQERSLRDQQSVVAQLQAALTSRIVIEQAKGVLAEQGGTSIDVAFDVLSASARAAGRKLGDLAGDIVARRISLSDLTQR